MVFMKGGPRAITVENRLEELNRVYSCLEGFAAEAQLPEQARRSLLLVTEELFTNMIHHGYEDGVSDTITIVFGRDGDDIKIVLRDHARAFDLAQTPTRPDEKLTLDEMKIGGLGLFLVHELARSVINRRNGDANETEVRLPADGSD